MPLLLCKEGYHNASCLACMPETEGLEIILRSINPDEQSESCNERFGDASMCDGKLVASMWQACGGHVGMWQTCGGHACCGSHRMKPAAVRLVRWPSGN